jgi:hypothetical protein
MMGVMRRVLLVLLLAACGDDGVRHTPDAAPHDGQPDSPIDTAGNPVTFTATRDGTPISGMYVYFQNADSTVVLATTTDANGTASAVMDAGGYVTAIDTLSQPLFGGSPPNELLTYVGVKPGDQLQYARSLGSPGIGVTINAVLDPAATSMWVYSPCLPDGQQLTGLAASVIAQPVTTTTTLYGCGATTDFLLVSYDQNNLPLNTAFIPNVPVADQGTVDLSAAVLAGADTKTWTFNNGPALTSLSVEDDLIDAQGRIFSTYMETPSDEQNPTLTMPVPAFTGAGQLVQTFVATGNDHTLLDWGPYASTFTTDVGARMLAELTAPPSFDPATHTASISEAATGAAADFALTALSASRVADSHTWVWEIIAPHATSIALPRLPTDVYDFNITAADNAQVEGWAIGKVPGGYDAVRPFLFSTKGPSDLAKLSGTGTASIELYEAPPTERAGRRSWRDTMGSHAPAVPSRVLSRRVR